jgi:hypothetical protein
MEEIKKEDLTKECKSLVGYTALLTFVLDILHQEIEPLLAKDTLSPEEKITAAELISYYIFIFTELKTILETCGAQVFAWRFIWTNEAVAFIESKFKSGELVHPEEHKNLSREAIFEKAVAKVHEIRTAKSQTTKVE